MRTATVEWEPGASVTLRVLDRGSDTVVVLAHGAGVDQDHPLQVAVRDGIADRGFDVVTFNYAYTEKGSKRPDRTEKLLTVHRAVADWVHSRMEGTIVLAGRSMGGRMGTMLAAEGYPASRVIALAYPLHPIGKPERLRSGWLNGIKHWQVDYTGKCPVAP